MKNQVVKPFIKWVGGKSQLLDEIRKYYPRELGKSIYKYAEPFIGGGAVLFDILSNYTLREVYISDSNAELINAYSTLRDFPDELIALLKEYEISYIALDAVQRKNMYYEKRARFNQLKKDNALGIESAALFIFLNKTCFNGLYRVNSKGEYNVPMGSYKCPTICDEMNLRNISEALQWVTIVCADYQQSDSFMDEHTFAYFDPPYRPLSSTSSFTAYTENNFDDIHQKELSQYILELSKRGIYVLASNSDPTNANSEDMFFDDLYADLEIHRVHAARMINSDATMRGKIRELLICNRGDSTNEKRF